MPSTYSDQLRLELQASGENSNTWGTKTNTNLELVEAAISGMASIATTGGDTTLTTVNGADDQSRHAILNITGILTSNANIVVPAKTKIYGVWNATDGAYTVTVKTAAGTGTLVDQGTKRFVFCDGTNVEAMTLDTGTLAISEGGTGQTTQTAAFDALAPTTTQGDLIYHNGTDNVRLAKGTAAQFLKMNAGATAPEWVTVAVGSGDVTGQSSSVDNEIALFSGTGGKTIKRATTTGVLKATSGVIAAATAGTDFAKPNTASSWTAQQTFKELKDTVYTITDGAGFEIDPANGSIQVVTLGASRTPAATNFEAGQTVLLGIDDGTAYSITWTTVNPTWVKPGGTATAPTLATTGYTWILLWKVGSTVYATEVGKP